MTVGEFIDFCEEENISRDAVLGIDIDIDFVTNGYYLIDDNVVSVIKEKRGFNSVIAFKLDGKCKRIIDKRLLKEIID